MNHLFRDFEDVPAFSAFDKAFARKDPQLMSFLAYKPELADFAQAIEGRKAHATDRQLLVDTLLDQYGHYAGDTSSSVAQIRRLLDSRTFTVTTAHQPVLFGGPAYLIYKIISTLRLARDLATAYPYYHFVPVFVSGGEDHDFEECQHVTIYGKTITWQRTATGAVGRLDTEGIGVCLSTLREILGTGDHAGQLYQMIEQAHTAHGLYGRAFAQMIHSLFGASGLVVLHMDEHRLKAQMVDIFAEELVHQSSSRLVRNTQQQLEAAGFKPQAHARDINLFLFGVHMRERLEFVDGHYRVVNTDLKYTEREILGLLRAEPDRFSPNVVLRPLYQETVLPNLAYVGGGGELAYWAERKAQFEHFGVPYPVLVRRDSCLYIDGAMQKRLNKVGLHLDAFFHDTHDIVKQFLLQQAGDDLQLDAERKELTNLWVAIAQKAARIDASLKGLIAAESAQQLKSLTKIEERLRKAEKQRHDTAINQIGSIREKLFPGGGMQERQASFMEYYLRQPETYFQQLVEVFDPLDMRLKIISE